MSEEQSQFLPANIEPGHKNAFWRSINDLHAHFGKEPDPTRAKLTYKRLAHLPKEAFSWCVDRMQDELDRLPLNLSKSYQTYYSRFKAEVPQQETVEKAECEHCNSWGVFSYVIRPSPLKGRRQYPFPATYCARCALCTNWVGYMGTWLTALDPRDVAAAGHEVQLHPPKVEDRFWIS